MACRLFGAKQIYLNQCWIIVDWTLENDFQWNFNQNTCIWKCLKNIGHFVLASMCWCLPWAAWCWVVSWDTLVAAICGHGRCRLRTRCLQGRGWWSATQTSYPAITECPFFKITHMLDIWQRKLLQNQQVYLLCLVYESKNTYPCYMLRKFVLF